VKNFTNTLEREYNSGGEGMITIFVCLGSSCYLKGAYDVINAFEEVIHKTALEGEIELKGAFCLNHCTHGVTIKINEEVVSGIASKDVPSLFEERILPMIRGNRHERCNDESSKL
jgi:NADH:ubiquinone oxidoreductase subunit E